MPIWAAGEHRSGKRGRSSKDKTLVLLAVQGTDEGWPVRLKLSLLGRFRKGEVEQRAKQNLEPGTTANMEGQRAASAGWGRRAARPLDRPGRTRARGR